MFVAYCPTHGREVLLGERRIRGLRNGAQGIEVELECWDGERLLVRTGRPRPAVAARAEGLAQASSL